VRPVERLAVWLYKRPRLRRAWKANCALWFGTAWAVIAAPTAAAYVTPGTEPSPLYASGQNIMEWTGLVDSYGVPVSHYFLSLVSPLQTAEATVGADTSGLSALNPFAYIGGVLHGLVNAVSEMLAFVPLEMEAILLIAIGIIGIWFLQFAISAPWIRWLAGLAQPVVVTLQQMVNEFYVIPICLLISTGYGGVVWLTKGRGRGAGIIGGAYLIILAYYLVFNAPTELVFGDNGILGIGQYLGFIVAEGVANNGALTSGNGAAQLGSLISLLCTGLLREQLELINFGDVIDNIPGCLQLYNEGLMSGGIANPATWISACDPAAGYHAQTLGIFDAGWLLVLLFVEFVIMLCLIYNGFHVVGIGFRAFFNLVTLVVAVALAVAPGPLRRYAGRQVRRGIRDGVQMFAATGGLAIVTILIGSVLSYQGG
jgi:hypothetical protein